LPDDRAVPLLVDLALHNPNRSVRKSAVQMLGNTDDPRALEALVQILQPPR
jgi:HEAT repeat protein